MIEPGQKISGLSRGVKGPPRTTKQLAALRSAGYKQKGKAIDGALVLASGNRNLPAIQAAHAKAYQGDFDDLNAINGARLGRLSGLQEMALDRVEKDGLTVNEDATDSEGRVIASRMKVHPLLPVAMQLSDTLGISATEQLLTPKSRGVSQATAAATKYWNRSEQLRDLVTLADRKTAIDTEILPDLSGKGEE